MVEHYRGLVDHRGRPIEKRVLTTEIAAASTTGVRTPLTGYPGDGLDPVRLAQILREADMGNPVRALELAETVEERDPHLVGILGTRKRSVSQLEITVEDGSSAPEHKHQAEMVREWLKRDELTAELFDMLDAIHKGYSFTEIVWDTSEGQWSPDRLEWRDPRWFDFERWDLRTPQLITEAGGREPLPAGKFVFAPMAAKSGIPTRSGLSRVLSWVWMFKAFSSRDWAIFSQTYGQPVRVGKFGQGASEDDKRTLLRAVANIAGDMAAIIPASMAIDFVESSNVGAGSDLYEKRVTHLNLEASKAVLGQTTTTDAVSGGHAVSQEHRLVQEDIERSDCRQLAAHLNRDLIKIWINLEFGPQSAYPRLRIGRPERRDVAATVAAVRSLGLPVKRSEMYALVGVSEPESGDDVLVPGGAEPADAGIGEDGPGRPRLPGRQPPPAPPREQLHAERTDPGRTEAERLAAAVDRLAERGEDAGAGAMELMLELIGDMIADPTIRDLEDLRARLLTLAPSLSTRALATAMRQAMVLADLSGRADLIDGPGA